MTDEGGPQEPPLLDRSLLNEYEQRLHEQGTPVQEWLNSGASSAEMAAALAPVGLQLPLEGRVLWGWHDGATSAGQGLVFGNGKFFLPLADMVEQYGRERETARGLVDDEAPPFDDPDFRWQPGWLPFSGDPGHPAVIDCAVPDGQPTPVRCIDWADQPEEYGLIRARSLGELIHHFIRAIDSGAWRWNATRGRWDTERELLGPDLRVHPLL
jgi:cell wall assembly regulator SMI1